MMGQYKRISIELHNLGFDVDGSVTYADVCRPAPNESAAERLHRLAAKAIVSGCEARRIDEDRWLCTSATAPGRLYLVDLGRWRCDCAAGGVCCHRALCLVLSNALPDPNVFVDRSHDAARPMAETLDVAA